MNNLFRQIFRTGSKTFFYSSIFFPPQVKEDVFKVYSFVRLADDLVDTIPQNKSGFYAFKKRYQSAQEGEVTSDIVIDSFVELVKRKGIKEGWVDAFLHAMELDLSTQTFSTIEDVLKYIYGSAEVVGLIIAKILELPKESYKYARAHGRSMQYINFIRDLSEDLTLGRVYFPQNELKEHNLENLEYNHVVNNLSEFKNFLHVQLTRYMGWQQEAENGFHYIPKRYLIPIQASSEMFKWTARVIWNNPLIIYTRTVKPSILRIMSRIGYNMLFA